MEYPGSLLTKPWRHLILVLFISAFFLLTPLVILYATGYRFDKSANLVRKVGILSINGIPHATTVRLNDVLNTYRLPFELTTLIPGTYHLSLSASGHHTWDQTITIRPQETTYIKDVDLPRVAEPERLLNYTPKVFVVLPHHQALVYTEKTATGTVLYYRPLESSFAFTRTTTSYAITSLRVSPHEEFIAAENNGEARFFIDVPAGTLYVPAVSSTLGKNYHWDAVGTDREVYYEQAKTIAIYNIITRTSNQNVRLLGFGWYPYKNTIWNLTTSSLSATGVELQGSAKSLFFKDRVDWNKSLWTWSRGTQWQLMNMVEDTAFFLSPDRTETALVTNKKITTLPVNHLRQMNDLPELLLYGSFDIWRATSENDPVFMYRSSQALRAVDVMNDTHLYLIATEHRIFSYQDYYTIETDLATDVTIEQAYTIPSDRTIIFSGTYRGNPGLWKLIY